MFSHSWLSMNMNWSHYRSQAVGCQVMSILIAIIKETWRIYSRNAVHIAFFNCIWLVLQVPIVTAPAATAAMYAIAHRLAEGELVTPRDVWKTVREVFIPAWKWAAVNLLVLAIMLGNLWLARGRDGDLWAVLRLVWTLAAILWLVATSMYWPLWLAESDRSVGNTLRNCFVLLIHAPVLSFSAVAISAAVFVLSVVTILPLVNGAMIWIAVTGLLTREQIVRQIGGKT